MSARVPAAARLYLRYAGIFLVLALGLGTWLRAIFVWPWLKGPFTFQYLLHAHSHVAFFGWVTPALFGIMAAAAAPGPVLERRLRLHAHALGALSLAALLAFSLTGYSPIAIAISALHVVLWYVFALPVRRRLAQVGDVAGGAALRAAPGAPGVPEAAAFYRAALALLLVAGTATLLPAILTARGVQEGWLRELGIKLFLTPFITGWLTLGAMGAVYAALGLGRGRGRRWALALTGAGAVPSTLLFVAAPAPWPPLVLLGRAGALLVGLGGLAFASDVLRARGSGALLRLAGGVAALKGGLELAAASGVGATLLHDRSVVLAYLHLVLLGLVTPALLAGAAREGMQGARLDARAGAAPGSERRLAPAAAALALGLALMCAALLALGWPALARAASSLGVGFGAFFPLAFAGGALCAAAAVFLFFARPRSVATAQPLAAPADEPVEVA